MPRYEKYLVIKVLLYTYNRWLQRIKRPPLLLLNIAFFSYSGFQTNARVLNGAFLFCCFLFVLFFFLSDYSKYPNITPGEISSWLTSDFLAAPAPKTYCTLKSHQLCRLTKPRLRCYIKLNYPSYINPRPRILENVSQIEGSFAYPGYTGRANFPIISLQNLASHSIGNNTLAQLERFPAKPGHPF